MKLALLYITFLSAVSWPAAAQEASPQSNQAPADDSRELTETIARAETAMFKAFNAHNLDALMSMFTDDLEFYHDKGGLTSYQQTAENFKKLFLNNPDIRRDLIKDSLEVYPVKNYGGLEIGAHRFCHQENGKEECGTFKFVMVWRKTADLWKVSRVISYRH